MADQSEPKTDSTPDPQPAPERDKVVLADKRRLPISPVWLFPIVAALVSAWLIYFTFVDKGPTVNITFKTAEGLEAGKTQLRYKEVVVGSVEQIHLSEDLSGVVATAQMDRTMEGFLSKETRFWVVRPRLTAGGFSGFGTLVSGSYIELDPVKGEEQTEFSGLEMPPVVRSDDSGTEYLLFSESLGSVNVGSPITYRSIKVGEVLGYELSKDNKSVEIRIFVKEPHDGFIREGTRFWNASGVSAKLDSSGVKISLESLASLVGGGVAFLTPPESMDGPLSAEGSRFPLHETLEHAIEQGYQEKHTFMAYFEGSVRGLEKGAPVEFNGFRLGTVTGIALDLDVGTLKGRARVTFDIEPQRIPSLDSELFRDPERTMTALVEKGLRAQLQRGNVLTGQLLLDLNFHEVDVPATLIYGGEHPEVPAVASGLDQLTATVNEVLKEIAALPLKDLVQDVRGMVRSIDGLAGSPKMNRALTSLDNTLAGVNSLVDTLDKDVGPLVVSLRKSSDEARDAISMAQELFGKDTVARHDVMNLLRELASAARSIRFLAEHLEKHPESLIQGKGDSP